MKLEDQVASPELCKRLKELGVRQESAFYWVTEHNEPFDKGWVLMLGEDILERGFIARQKVSAFTVAELGEMLPEEYFTQRIGDEWAGYEETDNGGLLIYIPWSWPKTEANARAKMRIYLIEEGIVKP